MTITFTQLGKQGRMGNQIWQASCVIGLAIKNDDDYIFPRWQYENDFRLHGCFSNSIFPTMTYVEPFFHHQEIPYKNTAGQVLNLSGYFQSYKYFDHCKDTIVNLFTPIHNFEKENGLCSIHIRRGDYLNFQDCHPIMTLDYYNRAMEKSGCKKFLIFSDDISWAKNNFTGNMFEFSENINPTIDLALMCKKCEHNIIANSSMSWWGAYLNQSVNKIVVAPKLWFGSKLNNHDIKNLMPNEWIKE